MNLDRLPDPRTPDPMAAPVLRWGVLGTGWIAERFVDALHRNTAQRVVAVASRDRERGARFAGRFGIETSYGDYPSLVTADDLDVVYVATPHTEHLAHARLSLEAGLPTLIEKPIGLNAAQAQEIATLARQRGVFCMEAFWTLFLPKFDVIAQILDAGLLGDVRSVQADHGEWFSADHRIMDPALAGGPLLDLGPYPVGFATWVLGPPVRVQAAGHAHPRGVNAQAGALLTAADDRIAVLHTTMLSNTPTIATIAGTDATLTLDGPFFQPGGFTLTSADGAHSLRYDEPEIGHAGLYFEAAEVARRVAAGELESPIRPLADSILTLTVLDEIRSQLGVTFPGER